MIYSLNLFIGEIELMRMRVYSYSMSKRNEIKNSLPFT